MGRRGFRELQVWQRAKRLAVETYQATGQGAISRDFGLRDQIRRAAVSVCSNIAEGDERRSDKDANRFFFMAKGSLAELISQLEIAGEIKYIDTQYKDRLVQECDEIGRMLGALIKARGRQEI